MGAVAAGALVGYADLFGDDPVWRELGYAVGPRSSWGQGFGTEIARPTFNRQFAVTREEWRHSGTRITTQHALSGEPRGRTGRSTLRVGPIHRYGGGTVALDPRWRDNRK